MNIPNVTNLSSPRSGEPVANQYNIATDESDTFQSYKTVIAVKEDFKYTVASAWNYSRTTTKYFYQWLRGFNWNAQDIDELKKFLKTAKEGDTFQMSDGMATVKYVEDLK